MARRPADSDDVHRVGIWHDVDAMRHTRIDEMGVPFCSVNVDMQMEPQPFRVRKANLDLVVDRLRAALGLRSHHICLNQSCKCFELHVLGGDTFKIGKPRRAPSPIAAEFCFAAVSIEESPAEIRAS